jgi:hypothetical protein
MIKKLNRGLPLEFMFVAAFIGLAFRSWVVMLATILPGIFPVVLAGMVLWALGEGLQFASVVVLTVLLRIGPERHNSFPKSVSAGATAGRGPGKSCGAGNRPCRSAADSDVRGACMRFDRHGLLRFSVATPVWLVSAFAKLAALAADLLILRPTVSFLSRFARRIGGRPFYR